MEQQKPETQETDMMFDESAANRMLKELDDNEDFIPDKEGSKTEGEESQPLSREQEAFEAIMSTLKMYEVGIKMVLHKRFVLSDEEREEIASGLAPALAKYAPEDGDMMSWFFGKFEIEAKAGYALFLLGSGTLSKVKALKKEDAIEGEVIKKKIDDKDDEEPAKDATN